MKFRVGTRAGPAVFQPVPPVGWIGGDVEMESAASLSESWGVDTEVLKEVVQGRGRDELGEQVAGAATRGGVRSMETTSASRLGPVGHDSDTHGEISQAKK